MKVNQIFVDGKWKTYQPYIFHNGVWREARTNIYNGNEWIEIPKIPLVFFDTTYLENIVWDETFYTLFSNNVANKTGLNQERGIHYYTEYTNGAANISTPVFIPCGVKALKVKLGRYWEGGRSFPKCSFGFLPNKTGIKMTDTSSGGVLVNETLNFNSSTAGYQSTTYSLTIPEDYKGSEDYRIIINFLGSTNGTRCDLYIQKVWFE